MFPLVAPFLLGLLITYIIKKPVEFLEMRFNLPRGVSVSLILFLTLLVICFALTLIISRVYLEIKYLLADLPEKIKNIGEAVEEGEIRLQEWLRLPKEFYQGMLPKPENLVASVRGALQEILGVLLGFPSFLFQLVLSGLAAYFFSRDKEKIFHFLCSLFPESWRRPVLRLYQELILTTLSFIKVQLILVLITALLTALIFGISGYPRAGLIALTVGLLDFLPMFGPAAFFLPWAGWLFFHGQLGTGIFLIAVLLFILGVREVAEVRLLRRNLGIHPLTALLSVYLGLKFFGVFGFFIGPVCFMLMRSFYYFALPFFRDAELFPYN